ncbi:MAG: tetratricopeptide repeat protein [Candidatus Pacebacteria bacterium]|nr:tetratricopeptide repeat protein [Candidatus Paceibacterota bacterium]
MESENNSNKIHLLTNSLSKKISFFVVIGLALLLPIFVIPSIFFPFLTGKAVILCLAIYILFTIAIIERIKNKYLNVSKNILIIFAGLVPLSYLFSALFSGSIMNEIMGINFETNTFVFILGLFLLMFFVSQFFSPKKDILPLYGVLLTSTFIMMIFHTLRLIFGPNFLSFGGMLNNPTSNLLGTWNELGIFFGLITILSLITAEFLGKNRILKITSYITLTLSLFFVALVNFSLVWISIAGLSLLLIIYKLFINKPKSGLSFNKKRLPIISLIVFSLALLFFFTKGSIGSYLPSFFEISNVEVRPTISSTIDIAKTTLAKDPIFGVGPTKFVNQWVINKPIGVNNTQFWNVDFNYGTSFLLTSLTTIGLFGFLSWILFIGTIIFLGLKLLKISQKDTFDHYIALSIFSITLYLLIFLMFYIPGVAILGLTFLFLGILLSLLYQERLVRVKKISLKKNKLTKILFIVIMSAISAVIIANGYLFVRKTLATIQFQKSLISLNNENNIQKSFEYINKALGNFKNDLYYRALTELNLIQLQAIFNQTDVSQEVLQQQFQITLEQSILGAQSAVDYSPDNYQNWATLAKVYGSVVPLKLEGFYGASNQAYTQAIKLNPNNPLLALNLANLEIGNEDTEKAKEYIKIAIQMKNNYSDAYYLLTQLELNEGNNENALQIIGTLANVTPNDPQVFLQLGSLNYNLKNYENSKAFLERAVTLNPYFADAKYLLGLNYDILGEKTKAVGQFEDLKILIPDNTDIAIILDNIKSGREPFYNPQQQIEIPEIDSTDD